MAEWFEEWFGQEYLEVYPHRDAEDAARVVSLIERTIDLRPGATVLDICCGSGRHAAAFLTRGHRPIGIDLSRHLLEQAKTVAPIPLVRGDIRAMPFRAGSVDLAVNLFTSFGYFETDLEHARAIAEMVAPVRPGGWFVLDFLNAPQVAKDLVPRDSITVGGRNLAVERWLHDGGRFVVKSITAPDGRRFMERVRLYGAADLAAMIEAAGARVGPRLGSYDGAPLAEDSPRVILFARTA